MPPLLCSVYVINTLSFQAPDTSLSEISVHPISACLRVPPSLSFLYSLPTPGWSPWVCIFFIPSPTPGWSPQELWRSLLKTNIDEAQGCSIWNIWLSQLWEHRQRSPKSKGISTPSTRWRPQWWGLLRVHCQVRGSQGKSWSTRIWGFV